MLPLFKSVMRGCRRLAAHVAPPQSCPICLDELPVIGLLEAADGAQEKVHAKLRCKHKFCVACLRPYVEMKIRAREVEDDQLVCPVVECRKPLDARDLSRLGGDALVQNYTRTLKRVRDEKNPSARWCPRPDCGELIISESEDTFTCPKCGTAGCFRCRGYAHRFKFLCRAKPESDASYVAWEKSVGERRAVRACPQCAMRIWKNDGCNHMTCTSCRHEYCWVCDAPWSASHYSCYEVPFLGHSFAGRVLQHVLGYSGVVLIVSIISVYGFAAFVGCYAAVCVVVSMRRHLTHTP